MLNLWSLDNDTIMWHMLGTRRFMAWIEQDRPAYPQFKDPVKAPMREWDLA